MKLLIFPSLFFLLLSSLTTVAQSTVTLSIEEVGLAPSCGVVSDCATNTVSYNIIGTPSADLVGSRVESYILGINSGILAAPFNDPVSLSIASEAPCIIQGIQNNNPVSDFILAVGLTAPTNIGLLVAGPNVLHTFTVTYANLIELAAAELKIMATEPAPLNTFNSELRLDSAQTGNNIIITLTDASFTPDASNTSCFTLPITLVDYTVKAVAKTSKLNWTTATEINNDYFTVEKSIDGKDWTLFANVKGSGNSSNEINYELTDSQPFLGTNYYRLSQYDFNGDMEILGIKAVQFNNEQLDITIHPNPVVDKLTISIGSELGIEECILYNNVGRKVKLIRINSPQTKIDMSDLIKGIYHLQISDKHFKIMKN